MTTEQRFFKDILLFNALTYNSLSSNIGDLNKNIGISANYVFMAEQILGNTVTENYDLLSLFGNYKNEIQSDNSEQLKQSLQNVKVDIVNTQSYPSFPVCTHISTSVLNYSTNISSTFLSGQIYYFNNVGFLRTSIISVPFNFNLSGNQYNSYLMDTPLDFSVYGLDNFTGVSYSGSKLIKFDYSWSSCNNTNNLLIKLDYITSSITNYYLVFYWGTSDVNFISTSYVVNYPIYYMGTKNFINNLGIYTTNISSLNSLNNFSGRNNFWSNDVVYKIGFTSFSFIDQNPYLWAPGRLNSTLIDGFESSYTQPLRYPVINNIDINGIITTINNNYLVLYGDFVTSSATNQNPIASLNLLTAYSNNYHQNYNLYDLNKKNYNNVPLGIFEFNKNPKKVGLNLGNGYSLYNYKQQIPSFTRVIEDYDLFNDFYQAMILSKTYFGQFNKIISNFLNTLTNFFTDFFFGNNYNSIKNYLIDPYLQVSINTLKNFTQPYGLEKIIPLEFTKEEEDSLYKAVTIVSSKQYLNFNQGKLILNNDYYLPNDCYFEIYKPISVVCNGIDPYNQGVGLAFDYTINLNFSYSNQNTLNKTLYLMASKYLVSKSEYQYMIQNNQDVTGYYWLADPDSKDYNSYSVGSIDEFRLYGYSGYIPDLKDGVIRPILTKSFSPLDSTKYTYEQYVQYLKSQGIIDPDAINDAIQKYLDEGNSFYTINLNSLDDKFISLNNISICATNYEINTPKYWNDQFSLNTSIGYMKDSENGFLNLKSVILSGLVSNLSSPGYMITNIPIGNNCRISSIDVNSFGNNLIPGIYNAYVLPPTNQLSNEQPGKIQYSILNSGILDPSSIVILNNGGNFYFDFDLLLTQSGFTTGLGTSYPSIHINMDNLSRFSATVDNSYNLTSLIQTSLPSLGYNQGFILNPLSFVGLGYTTINLNVNILIDNYPTVDSFLIANTGLSVGNLENTANFQNSNNNFSQINYISGNEKLLLFDQEIFNTITVKNSGTINYISILCKLILINSVNPSGYIKANIYNDLNGTKNLVASSEIVNVNLLDNENYSTVILPINYTFSNNQQYQFDGILNKSIYWISIEQNLENCFLSLKGSYQGITTSVYSISSSVIFNDINDFNIYGGIGTNSPDLDLGLTTVNINSQLFGISSVIGLSTNSLNIFMRRNADYLSTNNQVYLSVNVVQNGINTIINSNPIDVLSIGVDYAINQFVFSTSLISGTLILSSNFNFTKTLGKDKIYLARSIKQYDVSSVGFATSSQINIKGNSYNFDFIFNKIFSQVNNKISAAFNLTNAAQFGLANPNTLRQKEPINIIDGYWSFSSQNINQPISVYPRAFYSNSSVIGTSLPTYQYLGYSHNIYLNIGYNSNKIYKQELVTLNAKPLWKSTWMYRDLTSYKNFQYYNIIQQTFLDSIYYHVGLGSTNINNNFGPKVSIFEGTFTPSGNLLQPIDLIIGYGTNSGVQVFINNNTQATIDTFSVVSSSFSIISASLGTSIRNSSIFFKIYYFTLSTASLEVYWNVGLGKSLINALNSNSSGTNTPYNLNSGNPVDNIVFMNVSKTLADAISVNSGFPPGDSFIIRSS